MEASDQPIPSTPFVDILPSEIPERKSNPPIPVAHHKALKAVNRIRCDDLRKRLLKREKRELPIQDPDERYAPDLGIADPEDDEFDDDGDDE